MCIFCLLSVFSRIVLVSVGNVTQEFVQIFAGFSRIVLVSVGNVTQELSNYSQFVVGLY